jgi:hypothetical protein
MIRLRENGRKAQVKFSLMPRSLCSNISPPQELNDDIE